MLNNHFTEDGIPKFYGATTIGERGQVVIPAEARKDLELSHSTKVMVFSGGPIGDGLLLLKADTVSEMLTRANQMISGFQDILHSETENQD
ncbi:AbrB/MazE/SpoVT family DNA-binding domain-containing protein [Chloroflexota bacterium]